MTMAVSLSFGSGTNYFYQSYGALSSRSNASEKLLIAGIYFTGLDPKLGKSYVTQTALFLLKHTSVSELSYNKRVTI